MTTPAKAPAAVGAAPFLAVDGLRCRYRGAAEWAIDGISFEMEPGQVVLVAGPSGCGKTTLLRCLNGLIPRSYREGTLEGSLRLLGAVPSGLSLAAISQQVGTVLQNPDRQIVGSSVENEIAFGLENLAVPREEMRVRVMRLLQDLDLAALAGRSTFRLSGGEKQKVAVAGTLAMEPSLLLLDEPFSNLDPATIADAVRLLRSLADAGKALLLIEHRIEDALALLPDRVLLLDRGRQTYWGDVPGFLEIADPAQMKLPVTPASGVERRTPARSVFETRVEDQCQADATPPVDVPAEVVSPQKLPGDLSQSPVPDSSSILEWREVTFGYDPTDPVISQASMTIRAGEVVAILGANGAGKSTLLKLGIGLLRPQSGEVWADGKPTAGLTTAALAHTAGYVFQDPSRMFFAPTVREELAFGPRNLGCTDDRVKQNVRTALQALDLEDLEDRSPLSLSFGQQKRVSIAAVVAMESRLLLLDEPTAGQDYAHTLQFMDAILAMPQFSAIAFITHDLDLAIQYATRVILLQHGQVRAAGPPETVLADRAALADCHLRPTSRLLARGW